jgi:hypothetical protein
LGGPCRTVQMIATTIPITATATTISTLASLREGATPWSQCVVPRVAQPRPPLRARRSPGIATKRPGRFPIGAWVAGRPFPGRPAPCWPAGAWPAGRGAPWPAGRGAPWPAGRAGACPMAAYGTGRPGRWPFGPWTGRPGR